MDNQNEPRFGCLVNTLIGYTSHIPRHQSYLHPFHGDDGFSIEPHIDFKGPCCIVAQVGKLVCQQGHIWHESEQLAPIQPRVATLIIMQQLQIWRCWRKEVDR